MTVVSTKSTVKADSPSFPPVDDAITYLENVNWTNVGSRTRKGLGNLILFAAQFSEKSYEFHMWLYARLNGMK